MIARLGLPLLTRCQPNDKRAHDVIGIELLSPACIGVNLDGLPVAADVERVMRARGFRILQRAS